MSRQHIAKPSPLKKMRFSQCQRPAALSSNYLFAPVTSTTNELLDSRSSAMTTLSKL